MVPHTPAWFSITSHLNPDIANSARRNIQHAGHTNICSICGDNPEGDFLFMSGTLVLRLCPGCKEICNEAFAGLRGITPPK